jgi:hypothetical protein
LNIIESIEETLEEQEFPQHILDKINDGLTALRIAYVYAQRIDYLMSGDDGEESFVQRLDEELNEL